MISFENDYLEGAHEKVLKRLIDTNMVQAAGYGFDDFSSQAADKIRETIKCPEATVRFLVGNSNKPSSYQFYVEKLRRCYISRYGTCGGS